MHLSYPLFSRTGGVLSHRNSSQHTSSLDFHRGTRAPSSRLLCFFCLRCNGHSLLLSSYLFRIGRIENPSCSACGHSSLDISHLILHCPLTGSAPFALWGHCLYDLWSRPWGIARLLGLRGLPPSPHPSERVG